MKTPIHRQRSLKILTHLTGWGFTPDVQQRIGTLAVVWGVFESTLETTLWKLRDENVDGVRPWTDKTSPSDWITELGKVWPQFSSDANSVLGVASLAAKDLIEYRHALMHGSMIPSTTMPTFIRNPLWNGEKRKRPTHDAHVDENLLDMAIDSAWSLCQVVFAAGAACADPARVADVAALNPEAARARSQANELRHLTDLVNSEKY